MRRLVSLLALCAGGCEVPVLVGITNIDEHFTDVRLAKKTDVDVLFVVDTSSSMAEKQARLGDAVPALIAMLGQRGTAHIGAVSADLGAPALGAWGCLPGGDGAALRVAGPGAPSAECPGTSDGSPFIVEDFARATSNRAGQALTDAVRCMVRMGTAGCPIQQPLSAAHTALDRSRAHADGFLRDDALLVLVYITDGDDCSLPADSDLFAPSTEATYGPLSPFRCARFGIAYGNPARQVPATATGGPLALAAPMPWSRSTALPGRLVDVGGYRDELRLARSASGPGLKSDPNDVLVLTITGPPEPFEIVEVERGTDKTASPIACTEGPLCGAALKHACQASATPALFGAPAVRLRAVADSIAHSYASPICSVDQTPALGDFGRMLAAQEDGTGCLSGLLESGVSPQCDVADVNAAVPPIATKIPACTDGNPARPCWRLLLDPSCSAASPPTGDREQRVRLDIDRGGSPAPSGSVVQARCASPAS